MSFLTAKFFRNTQTKSVEKNYSTQTYLCRFIYNNTIHQPIKKLNV